MSDTLKKDLFSTFLLWKDTACHSYMEKNVNVFYIANLEGLGLDIFSFKQNIRSQRFCIRTQKITSNGDSTTDVQYKTTKAHANFANLRNIWKSFNIRTKTKIRIFKTNRVLALSPGRWQIAPKLNTFRRVLKIFWPCKQDQQRRDVQETQTAAISDQIKKNRWKRIGHVRRQEKSEIPSIWKKRY